MPKVRLLQYALGIQGMAVLRTWLRGADIADPHARELVQFANSMDSNPLNDAVELMEYEVASGYREWSATYDDRFNPLITTEEPIVRSMIDALPLGCALDAACGTGRHADYLCARGFDTVGVDASTPMLVRAHEKVPKAQFFTGDLKSLPLRTESFDVAVCALALDHCADLATPARELSRVVRRGGSVIVSVFHPMNAVLGGGAFFRRADGARGIVRSYTHGIADYVAAFLSCGLDIAGCVATKWSDNEIAMTGIVDLAPKAFRAAIAGVPLALIWQLKRR